MIKIKAVRSIAVIAIVLYVTSGLVDSLLSPSSNLFYEDFVNNYEKYDISIMSSLNFDLQQKPIQKQVNMALVNCIQTEKRTFANLGGNEKDKNIYIMLSSDNYTYKLVMKWRIEQEVAYITGIENREYSLTGEEVSPSGLGKLGGNCFHKWLSEVTP